ncbi:hypothetical protein MSG28_004871 [Choristoneura fumiferana]|uniref:Uncharacterized protein n=1 Tax=Choristoneura fumiferana TaxID=7141 RepID=A0ACC0K8B0_CHOFU|nr:hypothetical protein MSG28_004871 [Choristoneura fumiferana]
MSVSSVVEVEASQHNFDDDEILSHTSGVFESQPKISSGLVNHDNDEDEGFTTVARKRPRTPNSKMSMMEVVEGVEVYLTAQAALPKQLALAKLLRAEAIGGILKMKYKGSLKVLLVFDCKENAQKLIDCKKMAELGYSKFPKCKEAVTNFTETQSGHIELNAVVTKQQKDEDDVLECLISHKNDPEIKSNIKCKAAIDHEQLISLRNYRFTRKFKNACKSYVVKFCPKAQTKIQVVTCLSEIVRNDTINRKSTQYLKNAQKESIDLDPELKEACKRDLQEYCPNMLHAESAALECLQTAKGKLTDSCRKAIFVVRKTIYR